MTYRCLAAAAVALVAACGGPKKTGTDPTSDNVCTPKPFAETFIMFEISAGGASLLSTDTEWMLAIPRGAVCPDLSALVEPAETCFKGGSCGAEVAMDQVAKIDLALAKVGAVPVSIGTMVVSSFVTDMGTILVWPRGEPAAEIVRGASTPGPAPAPGDLACCPGCAPCIPDQCTSTPPIRPGASVHLVTDRCEPCAELIEKYCKDGGEPEKPGACECADRCCPPSS